MKTVDFRSVANAVLTLTGCVAAQEKCITTVSRARREAAKEAAAAAEVHKSSPGVAR